MKTKTFKLRISQKIFLIISFWGIPLISLAQKVPLPKDHPIAVAAPHLPLIARYEGIGREFHGENYTYNSERNEDSIKQWIKNYPAEVTTYKDAIVNYLKTIDPSSLSDSDKEVYYDLKSQWLMVSQIN